MSASVSLTQPGSSALDEETARAELYGVLAALYYAAPTPELLAQLRVAATEAPAAGGFLEEPWRLLVGAAREHDDAALVREYDALFGGVGKPEVYLYGSHYLSGFLNEKPLAALRGDLDAARQQLPPDPDPARAEHARAASELLAECGRSYQDLAGKADGHAADAVMLRRAWPGE